MAKKIQEISDDFNRFYYDNRIWQHTYYLGYQTFKYPTDLWIYQEIIHEIRPDLIIETGTYLGGSALYLASICDQIGKGRIVSIDIKRYGPLPEHPRITFLKGSSTHSTIMDLVKNLAKEAPVVMAILDSDHTESYVIQEIELYSQLVTQGSYLIVEDTNINGHPVRPSFGPGPMEAVTQFISQNESQFIIDRNKEKFRLTANPKGYLKKIVKEVENLT